MVKLEVKMAQVELFQEKYKGMSITTDVWSVLDENSGTWTTFGKVKLGRTSDGVAWEYGEQGVKCTDNSFQHSYLVVGTALQRIVSEADDTFFTAEPKPEEKKEE
jgi:hypothetical protein